MTESKREAPAVSAEPIAGRNLHQALEVGCAAFPDPEDRQFLNIAYRCWVYRLRIVPEKIMGRWSLGRLLSYQLWRDADRKPIAVSGLYFLSRHPTAAWLGWFGIHPSTQGKGLGGRILVGVEAEAMRCGYSEMMVYHVADDDGLNRFYQRHGFDIVGESYEHGAQLNIRKKQLSR